MIEDLDKLLEETGQPGLFELRELLQEIMGGTSASGQLLDQRRLASRRAAVYRVRFLVEGWVRSLVVKRMEPTVAQRNQLVVSRWLPAIGLGDSGPVLLGAAAEREGQCVWHVYEDLGNQALETGQPEREQVRAVVELIAQIHMRFTGHLLLAECRLLGDDLGIHFYTANVRDALCCLELLRPPSIGLSADQMVVRDRLLARLRQLEEEQPMRAQALADLGGPETLLHGDLWTTNAFVLPNTRGVKARLIDWDQVGVGPLSYDLSTFLLRFPPPHRTWVLDLYREAVRSADWTLPPARDLNLLFETAEFARFANCIIWPAIALVHDRLGWGFEELAKVEQWFESWEPVLPEKYAPHAVNSASS
jgi:hypothetical protein